jgi:hypothetical protein
MCGLKTIATPQQQDASHRNTPVRHTDGVGINQTLTVPAELKEVVDVQQKHKASGERKDTSN